MSIYLIIFSSFLAGFWVGGAIVNRMARREFKKLEEKLAKLILGHQIDNAHWE